MNSISRLRLACLHVHSAERVSNPFATRYVRPGAVPYVFADGANVAELVQQLQANRWNGAIVGPHGSGKSTLLATLIPAIQRAGLEVQSTALHDGQRTLPLEIRHWIRQRPIHTPSPAIIVLDGFEQLGWWARRRLLADCARRNCGLLVTVHHQANSQGFPILYRSKTDLHTVQLLVAILMPTGAPIIDPEDVAGAFHGCHADVRETLFALYNLFEQRRRNHDA